MNVIKTYIDTQCELNIAKERLSLLLDRKAELYSKYFGFNISYGDKAQGGTVQNDNMINYLHDLHEKDYGTGRSLEEEINYQQDKINKLQYHINNIANSLNKLSGLEYKLFYEIVYNNINITKAVELVANNNNKDVGTIWKYYYPKIKKELRKLQKYSECTVN